MKKIAITARVETIEAIGERRDAISQEWWNLMENCGYLPVFLPNNKSLSNIILDEFCVDGIILTGGNDLSAYGGTAPERDELENFLIAYAQQEKLPLLGVCRGMQMILSYFGATLQPVTNHVRVIHRLNSGRHVNSFHNFGAFECPKELIATEYCTDGVIEAIHHSNNEIYGIMWHPERNIPVENTDLDFIKEVFE